MKEFDFYEYYKEDDTIKIYGEDIYNYFELNYKIIIDSIDFDKNQNVVLHIEDLRMSSLYLERKLLDNIEHLNDVEVTDIEIVLFFDCTEIILC
jgi:hypothetical protein